jgi:hypothetical protein
LIRWTMVWPIICCLNYGKVSFFSKRIWICEWMWYRTWMKSQADCPTHFW